MEKVTKINLASGRNYFKGYLNVDDGSMNPKNRRDVTANIFKFLRKSNRFDEILLSHFMMYVVPEEANILFKRWYGWLKKDGKLIIETSDARSISLMILFQGKVGQMFGYGDTAGHRWSYTPSSVKKLLREAGFNKFSVSRGGTHGRIFRDFTITATK